DEDALARTVSEQGLNLGLAFPADGGLSLVASDGRLIAADRLLMLLAHDLLQRNPGADVLFNMADNRALADLIRQQGGRPVMDDGGPARLRSRMKELAVPLAGEASGHIFFADRWYGFSDALYAAARLLEVLSLQASDSAEAFAL
ncbi:MAG TPA: phosphomannomutase/phosphoglucomutase, partial [Alcanivorax sp.]|nr:phosphomannomutase/phosphoglucomutase [Alcanivorax sp.]